METQGSTQSKKGWIKEGLIWGLFMFITMTFIFPIVKGDEISLKSVLISIPIWVLASLGFGYTTKNLWKKIKRK